MKREDIRSIVTGGPCEFMYELNNKSVQHALEVYFKCDFPHHSEVESFRLYRCKDTGLVFVDPMIPGSESFYSWIGSFSEYFPAIRWEYIQVSRMISEVAKQKGEKLRILDVGCGDGKFLKRLADEIPNIELTGLDVSEKSLSNIADERIQTIHGDTSVLEKMDKTYDIVTAFHLIEHIPDPVGFLRDLKNSLNGPASRLYVSNPLSPMHFETHFFDILNHPPHHLTRWNPDVMKLVGERMGFETTIFLPDATPLKDRFKTTFRMKYFWRQNPRIRHMIFCALQHIPTTFSIWREQVKRASYDGKILPDLMLSEMKLS